MAQQSPPPSLVFKVARQEPELVAPAKPTPRELKSLSVLDSQETLRCYFLGLLIYRNNPSMNEKDPVKVIREAIAQTLVFYYPMAGRLREGPGRKLSVDCTGEGVMFIEADANVTLDDFGDVLHPPFPCLEELLYDFPNASAGVLDCPLLLIQVTRLKCGGFIFGFRYNHIMSDGVGMGQFMCAVGEMARGALALPTPPCWNRELFRAMNPPCVTYPHHKSDEDMTYTPPDDMIEKTFFFGRSHISALRGLVPQNLRHCSTFDVLTACLWQCRTVALQFDPKENVHVLFAVDARGLNLNPPLPPGYYGNAATVVGASTTAESLCHHKSFGYALELVRKAKADVTEKYIQSFVDVVAIKGFCPPPVALTGDRCFFVSDARRLGFSDVDIGWGRPAHSGPVVSSIQAMSIFYTPYKNRQGDDEILVHMAFPRAAMKIFEDELGTMFNKHLKNLISFKSSL